MPVVITISIPDADAQGVANDFALATGYSGPDNLGQKRQHMKDRLVDYIKSTTRTGRQTRQRAVIDRQAAQEIDAINIT